MGKRDLAKAIGAAQAAIQDQFQSMPIWQRERQLALYNVIAAQAVRAYTASASPRETALMEAHRWFVEASIRTIPEVINRCRELDVELTVFEEVFAEAHEVIDFTHKYEQVAYSVALAERGQMMIHVASREDRLSFTYALDSASERDTLLRSAEHGVDRPLHGPLFQGVRQTAAALDEYFRERIQRLSLEACAYEYDDTLFALAKDLLNQYLQSPQYNDPFGLDPHVTVSQLTIADIRRLWAGLAAIHHVHAQAQIAAAGGDIRRLPIQTLVLLQRLDWYCAHLCRLTGLAEAPVREFLQWHIYDPAVSGDMPVFQPLFPIGDRIALVDLFIMGTNCERNFLKLVYRHPALRAFANAIDMTKEPTALRQLSPLFPEQRFRVTTGIVIPQITDADLVVYDTATRFLLIVQHKWLLGPDTVNESADNDRKLEQGVTQAVESRDHFRGDAALVRTALHLGEHDVIAGVEAVVVCRGAEPTGFFEPNPTVPVIAEHRFLELRAEHESLTEFWQSLVRRPDQERAASRAADVTSGFQLAGWEFRFPGLQLKHALDG